MATYVTAPVLEVTFDMGEEHTVETCAMARCDAYATVCVRVWTQNVVFQEDHACDDHESELVELITDEWRLPQAKPVAV